MNVDFMNKIRKVFVGVELTMTENSVTIENNLRITIENGWFVLHRINAPVTNFWDETVVELVKSQHENTIIVATAKVLAELIVSEILKDIEADELMSLVVP